MTGPSASARPATAAHMPKRVGACFPIGVDVPDDGQGAGLGGGRADPHDDPTGDSQSTLPAERRDDGAAAEQGDPDEHDPLAAEEVTEHPGRQHQAGECQRIAVDHPLQRGDPRMQVALDVGQADADDRVVEEGEEQDPAQGGERERLGG